MNLLTEPDKQKHMLGSAIGANFIYLFAAIFDSPILPVEAFLVMLVIGLIKETTDTNTWTEHFRDMVANSIGAATVFIWVML